MKGKEGFCSRFFSALANRSRVKILQELAVKPMNVNELVHKMGVERTLVSHYLTMLTKAELVKHKRQGRTKIYSVNEEVVSEVFLLMDKVVCSGCSIKKTCKTLQQRNILQMTQTNRSPCEACR